MSRIEYHRIATFAARIALLVLFLGLFAPNGFAQHNTRQAAGVFETLREERNRDLYRALGGSAPTADHTQWTTNQTAINQLRGSEMFANSLTMAMWSPWEITHNRFRTIRDEAGWNTWAGGYYRTGEVKADRGTRGFDTNRGGMALGADYGSTRHWQFGGFFGYGAPKVENQFGHVKADDMTMALYSKFNFFDQGTITTFLGYGFQDFKSRRRGYNGIIHHGSFKGDSGYASIEYARVVNIVDIAAAIPLVAIDHQTAWIRQFSETDLEWGGQRMAGSSMGRTMLRLGFDTKWDMDLTFDTSTRMQASVLLHGDARGTAQAYFPGSSAMMDLRGASIGRTLFNLGVTASGDYIARYNWFVDLDYFITERSHALQCQFGVSTRW